jgi:hypothetical protein
MASPYREWVPTLHGRPTRRVMVVRTVMRSRTTPLKQRKARVGAVRRVLCKVTDRAEITDGRRFRRVRDGMRGRIEGMCTAEVGRIEVRIGRRGENGISSRGWIGIRVGDRGSEAVERDTRGFFSLVSTFHKMYKQLCLVEPL